MIHELYPELEQGSDHHTIKKQANKSVPHQIIAIYPKTQSGYH